MMSNDNATVASAFLLTAGTIQGLFQARLPTYPLLPCASCAQCSDTIQAHKIVIQLESPSAAPPGPP